MALIQTICQKRLALHASKQGARSAEIWNLVIVFLNSANEPKPNFLRKR